MAARRPTQANRSRIDPEDAAARVLPDDEHPDYVPGAFFDDAGGAGGFTPVPGGPLPPFPPQPGPLPGPLPGPPPGPYPPQPFPEPPRLPEPFPRVPFPWPLRLCGPVSGKYTYTSRPTLAPAPIVFPFGLVTVTVRVDVDRFFPQNRISIEVSRLFPRATAHAVAEVVSDACLGLNRRRVVADITYRNGSASLIQGDRVVFEASRGAGFPYANYSLTLSGGGVAARTYPLTFRSRFFDPVEFEVDRVENAPDVFTSVDTAAHPNRPADLPAEVLTLTTVFERAGFEATLSPNAKVIPLADAGTNGTWSDAELHDAMVRRWSRFADRPQWAMWVLYAARHDRGSSLGGIMFDDIGPNHRQGTAIFTDSFIRNAPSGDANPAAWRRRSVFWTAVHEIGHGFNLAHSWQKALGVPQGAPGDPWIPLANEPEARSFMNYPDRVAGQQAAFYANFRYRFSDDELVFLRHAPRRFVQMGNANWFDNHGFEAPSRLHQSGRWTLALRPNRERNAYRFLEPVTLELKLTNASDQPAALDPHLLSDGRHVTVFVQREGAPVRQWRPMASHCHQEHADALKAGASIYGAHPISVAPDGWLIDEPGFYLVQAAVDLGDEVVVSNVLRVHVAPPASPDEQALAPDYFTKDVAHALVFGATRTLADAHDTLRSVMERCADNPAALHAAVAVSSHRLEDFKWLDFGDDPTDAAVRLEEADLVDAAKVQADALLAAPDTAADTLGHIPYFDAVDHLADVLKAADDTAGAKRVLKSSVASMKRRDILAQVLAAAERKLKSLG
jgi:hypothetical protein